MNDQIQQLNASSALKRKANTERASAERQGKSPFLVR